MLFQLMPLSKLPVIPKISCSIVLAIAIAFSSGSDAAAQNSKPENVAAEDTVQHRIEIGAGGGITLNQFSKGQPHVSQNTGYIAGLSVNYKVFNNFSLQLEVNATQQGGRLLQFVDRTWIGLPESFETKNVTNSSYALNAIDIPLLVNYTFALKTTWKPSLYVGGSYSYTHNVTEHYQKTANLLPGEDIIATASGSKSSTSRFTTNRANLIVGANIKLPLTSKLLFLIDLRYMNGLTPAIKKFSYMDKVGFGTDLRTNSFVSKLGIIYPL